jgi:nitrogen-specific signal transduction histidine kinase
MENARRLAEAALRKAHDELEQRLNERSEQLHAAMQAAKSANRAKSEFLSAMSHELRSPLGAIIGFAELLQEKLFGDLNPKQEEYVRDIVESGRHLLALINDILDLSKVESDSLDLSTFALEGMLDNSLAMLREKCHKNGIKQDLLVSSELQGAILTADERKLKQVMFNLLSNAAKFTQDGGTITVTARRDENEVIISVADTGVGVAKEDQQKIFDEFYQVERDAKGKTPGTGLGLPLVRRLVELHGGRVGVESEGEGKGSTFQFTIPVQTGQAEPARTRDAALDAAEGGVPPRSAVMRQISECVDRFRVGLGRFCCCRMDPVVQTTSIFQDSVVQELNKGKRENDTVLIDEDGNFVLILTNTHRAGAEVVCRRLAARLEERLGVAWRWALAVCPDDGQTAEALMEVLRLRAEKALHTAHQEHRDGIR